MKMYHNNKLYIVLLGIMLMTVPIWSCKKFVTLPLPNNQLSSGAIFDDAPSLTAALNTVYTSLAGSCNDAFQYPSFFADEMSTTLSGNTDIAQKNTYTSGDDFGYFAGYYTALGKINALLDGIDNATKIPEATRNQVKGEALFLRAFCYFQLVNFYGNVPLLTKNDINGNAVQANTPAADTYKQMITDLTAAVSLMPDDYVEQNRTRANKQTANALLARTYLYTKDYANAITTATLVINSPLYSMNPDLNAIAQANSPETIWQFWNAYDASMGNNYLPYYSAYYLVQPSLLNAFEAGDGRRDAWIATWDADAGQYYPYKWKKSTDYPDLPAEYLMEFRLAEMYLIRAEARAQTNDVSNGLQDIYVIRSRAGLTDPLTGITTSAQLLDVVASERRKELCFEGGHRWFDLIRTGKAVTVLSPLKTGFDAHLTLLPYPHSQMVLNTNLKQNLGYDD